MGVGIISERYRRWEERDQSYYELVVDWGKLSDEKTQELQDHLQQYCLKEEDWATVTRNSKSYSRAITTIEVKAPLQYHQASQIRQAVEAAMRAGL